MVNLIATSAKQPSCANPVKADSTFDSSISFTHAHYNRLDKLQLPPLSVSYYTAQNDPDRSQMVNTIPIQQRTSMQTLPVIQQSPEEIRKTYLNHEASVQSIGFLYLIGAVATLVSGILSFFREKNFIEGAIIGVFLIALGVLQGWVGLKLRKLDPTSKTPATILACAGLLAFPLGTIINAYILYLLHSAKGKFIFSEDYRAVIAATPHIKYKMSVVIWGLVLIIVLLLLGLIAIFAMKK